ncbi:MAG: US12 family protein [Myxococcales bacterium]|nr:US12 family protein [Myxococcales bacterium]
MSGWEYTINTGNPEHDRMTVDMYRQQVAAQGMTLQVTPLPQGGIHVRAVPAGQAAPEAAPAYAQQGGYGGGGYAGAAPVAAPQEQAAATPLSNERVKYLRKVYAWLGSAVLVAVVAGFAILELAPQEKFKAPALGLKKGIMMSTVVVTMINNPVIMYAAFGALVLATFIASWVSKVPVLNAIMLFLVAALMGAELAPMILVAQIKAGVGGTISAAPVRDAGLMTLGIFAGLTGYVFITRKDFSYLGAIASMGVVVVFIGCILAFVFQSEIFTLALCCLGSLVAGLLILWQTSYILNHSDMDDPLDDALVFLVQLRNLFMFLLRIFMSRD